MLHDFSHQVYAQKICRLEEVVRKFPESCLVHDHLIMSLSRRKEEFQSLFLPDPSKQVSAHEDIRFGGICCLKNIKIAVYF